MLRDRGLAEALAREIKIKLRNLLLLAAFSHLAPVKCKCPRMEFSDDVAVIEDGEPVAGKVPDRSDQAGPNATGGALGP